MAQAVKNAKQELQSVCITLTLFTVCEAKGTEHFKEKVALVSNASERHE